MPWPTYGYDNQRTHLSPFTHRPPYRRLWTLRARWYVEFPPVVGYGKVFVSQLKGVFYAVDAKTGKWRWRRKFPFCSAPRPPLAAGLVIETFIPPPCTQGPRGVPGLVIAMRQIGRPDVWRQPIASESSPLVVGGRVYVGSWDHRVYALGLGTGRCSGRRGSTARSTAPLRYAGGTVYVGDNSGTLTALDARTGAIRWKARSFSRFRPGREYFYATPTVAYGRVFASNTDGTVYAFGAGTGHLLWASHVGTYVYTAPAVWDKKVYVGTYDGKFFALDAATGDPLGARDARRRARRADGDGRARLPRHLRASAASTASATRSAGRTATFALDARTGKLVWTFPDGHYSPLVADEERVYLVGSTRESTGSVERSR